MDKEIAETLLYLIRVSIMIQVITFVYTVLRDQRRSKK